MLNSIIEYQHQQKKYFGYFSNPNESSKKPAVLICPDWSGRNEFACKKADALTELGYIGFAIDVYGEAKVGKTNEEKMGLMKPLAENRPLLLERLLAAFNVIHQHPQVNANKIAVIGYCFGGLCALDLARSCAELRGAVSFHGLLDRDMQQALRPINSKILVLHGYDDPMVKPNAVEAFAQEMTEAKADWQIHMYGHTMHAFTNPLANDAAFGTVYNRSAEQRSWLSMKSFLSEIFE